MFRPWFLIAPLVVGLVFVVGVVWAAPLRQETPTDGTGVDVTATPAASGPTAAVNTGDNFFEPQTITVAAGTTITWTNSGLAPHTITADDQSWDSGRLDSAGTFSKTFDTPGTYGYYCMYHGAAGAGMFGTIVVTDPNAPPADPAAAPADGQTSSP